MPTKLHIPVITGTKQKTKSVVYNVYPSPYGNPYTRAISEEIPDTEGMPDEDRILTFWRSRRPAKRLPLKGNYQGYCITNVSQGIGDCVILSDLPETAYFQDKKADVYSNSPYFKELVAVGNPFFNSNPNLTHMADSASIVSRYDCGPGHYIQRLQRAYGLKIKTKPKGRIYTPSTLVKGRVILHLDKPGCHAGWQRAHVHPRARELYTESKLAIEQYIANHPEKEFVEIGSGSAEIHGARKATGTNLLESVRLMATAEYFVGIISGPMSIAAALGIKSIVILNFPHPELIVLPNLKDTGQIEEEWLYPQNVHLHQEAEGPLVKRFSLRNLEKAFDGELYPYWSNKYLKLIHEKIQPPCGVPVPRPGLRDRHSPPIGPQALSRAPRGLQGRSMAQREV